VIEPDLGHADKRLEAGDDKRPLKQQEESAARKDRDDFRRRRTRVLARSYMGVFPSGFAFA